MTALGVSKDSRSRQTKQSRLTLVVDVLMAHTAMPKSRDVTFFAATVPIVWETGQALPSGWSYVGLKVLYVRR